MNNDGPLSTRQQLDALKLERERAKLLADQAKAQQQMQKLAGVPPVQPEVPFKATALGPTPEQLAEVASRQQIPPTVEGVTDPFQQWKNATMAVESSYGNNPKTWETNSSGARGLYQLTEATFNGLKKNKQIPEDYDFNNPVHNTEASEVLAKEVWEKSGQDPRKATAMWYSGPKAIDEKTGEIKALTDPKNPNFPNTLQQIDKVERVRLGGQQVPPKPYDETERLLSRYHTPIMGYSDDSFLGLTKPTPLQIIDAKNDVLYSKDPEIVTKAKSVLAIADRYSKAEMGTDDATEKVPAPRSMNEPVPVPAGIIPPEPGNEFGGVLEGETKRREVTVEELNKRISSLDPNNPLDLKTIQELEIKKKEIAPSEATTSSKTVTKVPPLEKEIPVVTAEAPFDENAPGFSDKAVAEAAPFDENFPAFEKDFNELPDLNKEKFNELGNRGSQTDPDGIKAEVARYAEQRDLKGKSGAPVKKEDLSPSFWSKLSESFGDLFSDKEFIRFGILLAGGLLTGGSFGGSLKYAGLYALQSADKREAAEKANKQLLEKEERAEERALAREERAATRATELATIKAKQESFKDLRERDQALSTNMSTALGNTKVPAAIRQKVYDELQKAKTLPLDKRVPAVSDLLDQMNKYASDVKPLQSATLVVDGVVRTDVFKDPTTLSYYTKQVKEDGSISYNPIRGMEASDYTNLVKSAQDDVARRVGAAIDPSLKNRSEVANGIASATTAIIQDMTTFGANIQPSDVANMAEMAMNAVGKYTPDADYNEWINKYKSAMYNSAAIKLKPNRAELFVTPDKTALSSDAYSLMRTSLAGEKLESGLDKLISQYDLAMKDKSIAEKVNTMLESTSGHSPLSMYLKLKAQGKL